MASESGQYPIPRARELHEHTLWALQELGGSAKKSELLDPIVRRLGLDENASTFERADGSSALGYELGWSLTFLKKAAAVNNSVRGTWKITTRGEELLAQGGEAIKAEVLKGWQEFYASRNEGQPGTPTSTDSIEAAEQEAESRAEGWRAGLLKTVRSLTAKRFEELSQLVLRESGFDDVQVRGRTGDGGIDGVGTLRINLVRFRIFFQCKKYDDGNPVGAGAIRDFQGAIQGRADKGIFITTSRFTDSARKEANRDGAIPIDLIDGEELCNLLKELRLGVTVETVEQVTVTPSWFETF